MALKQIMLAKKIQDKEVILEGLRAKSTEFETREKELEKAINEAATDEERQTLDGEVDKFTEERDSHQSALEKAELELEELRGELNELNAKAPKSRMGGERKNMGKRNEEELDEIRSGINRFVKYKGQEGKGLHP